jgi:ABC-2 type transport system permease protein
MRWVFLKDLQILRRSPLLVAMLVIYPIAIALLIGLALSRGPAKPTVAVLNEVPANQRIVQLGSKSIDTNHYAKLLEDSITPINVSSRQEAIDKVTSGDALAALIIPPDITQQLASGLSPASIEVIYNGDALKQSLVRSAIESKLGDANAALARVLAQIAAGYVDLLQSGGTISLPSGNHQVLGLEATQQILGAVVASLPRGSPQRAALLPVQQFTTLAVDNLGFSKQALKTVASPISVKETLVHGRRTPLDSFAVAVAVTISLMFVCMLLAAGMLAMEREEHTFARLVRGLVSRGGLLAEKTLLAASCSGAVTFVMLCGIGLFVSLDWGRLPLWLLALAGGSIAFATLGVAIGSVTREVRAASLLAFLLSLPIAFLALVPSGAVAGGLYDVIRVISAIFPFKPALEALDAAINESQPALGVALLHLLACTVGFGALARLALRRF